MKRIAAFITVILMLVPAIGIFCRADGEETQKRPVLAQTRFAYVYNLDDDFILYEENADKVIYTASTAKMMTAIIALEYYRDNLSKKITVTQEVIDASHGGTIISYKLDEVVTVEQFLHALIIANANDAAYALAFDIAGDEESFVKLMNDKAQSLGCENTHFANPTGVDDTQGYTTVRDVSKIACYAARMKGYTDFSSEEKYFMDPTNKVGLRSMANRNYLTSRSFTTEYYLTYCIGLNAGATLRGGNCCVALGSKNGVNMLAIAMNVAETDNGKNYAFVDCKSMLEWAYGSFGYTQIQSKNEIVYEVPVRYSSSVDHVSLLAEEDIFAFLPLDVNLHEEITREYTLFEKSLDAPVEEGRQIGEMVIYYGGQRIASVALVAKNAVYRSTGLWIWGKVKKVLFGIGGIVAAIAIIFIAVLVIFANAYMRARRERR